MKLAGKELKRPSLDLKAIRGGRGHAGSGVQAPPFLRDLYQDLRDRRLLPLVALLIVAIVAVPFLLSDGSEESTEPAGEGAISALKEASENSSGLKVVEAHPGLRDYHQRLSHRLPTDPFKQRYTAPVLKGAELNEPKESAVESGSGSESSSGSEGGSGATGGGSSLPAITTPVESGSGSGESGGGSTGSGEGSAGSGGGSTGGGGSNGGGGNSGGGQLPAPTLYSFAIDVRIVHSSGSQATGDKQTSKPDARHRVLPPAPLPGKKAEVVNYLGVSPKTGKPLFLVSTDVTGVFGEGHCAAGSDVCQLIELEIGLPETFVFGEEGDRYKITVLSVEPVPVG